jgi:hypothetical protein
MLLEYEHFVSAPLIIISNYNATVKNIIIFLYLYCPLVLNANALSKLILANYAAAPRWYAFKSNDLCTKFKLNRIILYPKQSLKYYFMSAQCY